MTGPAISRQDLLAALDDPFNLGFAATFPWLSGVLGVNTVLAANQAYWVRLATGGTITKIGYHVGAQSGNICLAAYANSGAGRAAVPGARLATTGSIACPAVGENETALGSTITVHRGDWLALACDNLTATFGGVSSGAANALFGALGWTKASGFPLANPAPGTLTATTSRLPILIGIP